jgi:hypothetical protein
VDSDYVKLAWTPPTDDGGSPITGYIIERFEKKGGGDWAPVNLAPVPGTEATIPNLFEGETYQFRVRACNAAGPGAPSRATEPITCRAYISRFWVWTLL